MRRTTWSFLAALMLASVPMIGCDDDSDVEDAIEDAADEVGDAAEEIGDKVEDAVDEIDPKQ